MGIINQCKSLAQSYMWSVAYPRGVGGRYRGYNPHPWKMVPLDVRPVCSAARLHFDRIIARQEVKLPEMSPACV